MSGRRVPCPQCESKTAFATSVDERGTVSFCHRCGYTEARNQRRAEDASIEAPSRAKLEWSTKAESIWRRTTLLDGSVGATYLKQRNCAAPPPDSALRMLPASGSYPPSLCAQVSDALTAQPLTLHFTRLSPDGRGKAGTDCDKQLLGGHRKKGGCIRLWPNESATTGLAIAEGIETALAAAHVLTPVWSCVDAGNLSAFPVLGGIDALTIFADHDDAGIKAAAQCAERWRAAGREVRVLTPAVRGRDTADEVSHAAA